MHQRGQSSSQGQDAALRRRRKFFLEDFRVKAIKRTWTRVFRLVRAREHSRTSTSLTVAFAWDLTRARAPQWHLRQVSPDATLGVPPARRNRIRAHRTRAGADISGLAHSRTSLSTSTSPPTSRNAAEIAPLAGPSGPGANVGQAPQPAKNTRLVDAMGRWSAAVKIAGEETEVFEVEHHIGKTTCYIAAEDGKEFEVQVDALNQPSTDECAWLYVDGRKCVQFSLRAFLTLAQSGVLVQDYRLRLPARSLDAAAKRRGQTSLRERNTSFCLCANRLDR